MAKLKLATKNDTFPLSVEVPTPHGPADVEFTARHITEIEWDEMRDEHTGKINSSIAQLFDAKRKAAEVEYKAAAKKKGIKIEVEFSDDDETGIAKLLKPVPVAQISKVKHKLNAELLAKLFTAWDLEEKMDVAALADMCNRYPGAAEVLFTSFDKKLRGQRLGN
jgi:hypothetical protein